MTAAPEGVGARYAERLARLAAAGHDLHGEARFVAGALARHGFGPAARILDAGCGTGRVAVRLAELGYDCVGADLDPSMLAEARRCAPQLTWVQADLETLDLGLPPFDLVLMAGNVPPLAGAAAVRPMLARLAAHLTGGGLLVAGFGLDARHLPDGVVPVPLADYDAAAEAAGLHLAERHSTWDADPYGDGAGYAVSVHRRG